jgi:hypothetical protein
MDWIDLAEDKDTVYTILR